MHGLQNYIKDVNVVLALSPEELGGYLLKLLTPESLAPRNGLAHRQDVLYPVPRGQNQMPNEQLQDEVDLAITEAWEWLRRTGLIVPAPNPNDKSGYVVLSRRGRKVLAESSMADFRAAVTFPRELLHPLLRDDVWLDLVRSRLDTAVFNAFKAVEVAVRAAGGFAPTDIGVALMRKAFQSTTGPLTDPTAPTAEQEALSNLFAGAVGSYKNPHSHRKVGLIDAQEAQEMAMLASHLLRIVDERRAPATPATLSTP